jgi:hypothetical protein
MLGLTGMQVCAVEDATDEEILEVCNTFNPAGTTTGWVKVCREGAVKEVNYPEPVRCDDHSDRKHFIVLC